MHSTITKPAPASRDHPGSAISTRGLTKHYGSTRALEALDLDVEPGVVFGYLGPNGAGKTTTIRLLVGLLRPTAGWARVLGMDSVRQRVPVQARVGYLPGDFVAYLDLSARDYLEYLSNLRGTVDPSRMLHFAERLELPLDRRIGELSHGNRQKVGLVQAFMHDPDLLILDEPTSGLDPLVQREFLAMVREARESGRTVFLSSHVLAEVEAVADIVGILRDGRLVVVERLDSLKRHATHRIELELAGPVSGDLFDGVPCVREVYLDGASALVTVEGPATELFRVLAPIGIDRVRTHEADLADIFLTQYENGATSNGPTSNASASNGAMT
jgi:ABC-2 type transport system ATP-binding protein